MGIKILKEHSTYDNGKGGVNFPIMYAGTNELGIHKLIGFNGLIAAGANQPAGVIVGAGQYRNKALKGEKLAVTRYGMFSVDTLVTIGAPLYSDATGDLTVTKPSSGYNVPVAFAIRDTKVRDMTVTTSKLIMVVV